MKNFIFYSAIISWVIWCLNAMGHENEPSPFKFWDNYGFKVGQTVIAIHQNENPFTPTRKPDTLVVKAIVGDFIQFTNGRDERFGSFGMNIYDWKVIK